MTCVHVSWKSDTEKRECERHHYCSVRLDSLPGDVRCACQPRIYTGLFEDHSPKGLFSSLQASATRRGARGAPASVGHGRTGRGGRTARARAGCVGCAASERAAREAGGCRGCRGCRRGAARGVCGVWSGVRAPVVEAEARAKHHSAATSFAREHAQHAGWGLDRAARRRVERM